MLILICLEFCFILIMSIFLNMFFKKPSTTIWIYIIHTVLIVSWHLNSCFINMTTYYQIISYLNTKSNLVVILLLLISLFLIFSKRRFIGYTTNIYMLLLITFAFCVTNTDVTKSTNTTLIENIVGINTNLLNGLMLIHPPILYFGYSYILFIFMKNICLEKVVYYVSVVQTQRLRVDLLATASILLISILLGGWWAEQELSWGGWWSWDFVELLALNIFVFALYTIHKGFTNKTQQEIGMGNAMLVVFCVLSILSVRFNIINSIHNFIDTNTQNQFYLYFSYLVFLGLFFVAKYITTNLFKKGTPITYVNIYFALSLLLFILTYIYILPNVNWVLSGLYIYVPNYKDLVLKILILFLIPIFGYKYMYTYHIWIFILIIVLYNIFTIWILLFLLLPLLESNLFRRSYIIKVIHVQIIVFFIFSLNQFYIFYNEVLLAHTTNISCLKVGTSLKLDFNFYSGALQQGVNFKNVNDVCISQISSDVLPLGSNQGHSSFSKVILIAYLNTCEFYSYNAQLLTQPIFLLILPLLTFQFLKLIFFYLTKKNISLI